MEQNNNNRPKMPKFNMSWIYILVLLALIGFYFSGGDSIGGSMKKNASYTEFKAYVDSGYAQKVEVNKGENVLKMFVKGEGKVIGLGEYPEKAGSKRSSIDVLSLSVPLLFTHRFGHQGKVRMTLGPVVNFNVRGRINNSYEIGDDEIEVSTKDIEYRPITVDLMGAVSYCNIGLYVKYSPMSVLKKDKGPDFHSLTFGFMF